MAKNFDIICFADPRFPGGTSTAISMEMTALEREGCKIALCPVLSGVFKSPRAPNPVLWDFVDRKVVELADPRDEINAPIVVIHHPLLFANLPKQPFNVRAETVVLVLHHPPFNGFGQAEYDLNLIVANIIDLFQKPLTIVPVGTSVRRQLTGNCPQGCTIWEEDWANLLDFDSWQFRARRPDNTRVVIGRHSRPQISKYPDTREQALGIYPDAPEFDIRFLGTDDAVSEHFEPVPQNWSLMPFAPYSVKEFLEGLDYFVYFHGRIWVEAFGYCILEAMAVGVPVILPEHFRSQFGPAALYATPDGVGEVIAQLQDDPDRYDQQARLARREVERRFALEQFVPRLDRLHPGWKASEPQASPPANVRERRVLFMTSNGVGLGHLSRCMAVASRLPDQFTSAFFTLSQGFRLAQDAGYLTRFVPFYRMTRADIGTWNVALEQEFSDFLHLFQPDIVVFDGNMPYQGMLNALDQNAGIKRVWMRRALWASDDPELVSRKRHFDLVLEPGELSGRFDRGATRLAGDAVVLPPILNIAPGDRLDRETARAKLNVGRDAIIVGLMLGAGANFDFGPIRNQIIDNLTRRSDVELIEFTSPIAVEQTENAAHRQMTLYPAFRYTKGLDAMVSGAGYNSFHESMLGAVPTLFVANEAPEMDLQILRARHAAQIGCARMLRTADRIGVDTELDALLNPEMRAEMIRRMAAYQYEDGAQVAADMIAQTSMATRAVQGFDY